MHVLLGANWNIHTEKSLFSIKKLQALLEISKIFVQGGGCTYTLLLPPFMGEVLSEERASY